MKSKVATASIMDRWLAVASSSRSDLTMATMPSTTFRRSFGPSSTSLVCQPWRRLCRPQDLPHCHLVHLLFHSSAGVLPQIRRRSGASKNHPTRLAESHSTPFLQGISMDQVFL